MIAEKFPTFLRRRFHVRYVLRDVIKMNRKIIFKIIPITWRKVSTAFAAAADAAGASAVRQTAGWLSAFRAPASTAAAAKIEKKGWMEVA